MGTPRGQRRTQGASRPAVGTALLAVHTGTSQVKHSATAAFGIRPIGGKAEGKSNAGNADSTRATSGFEGRSSVAAHIKNTRVVLSSEAEQKRTGTPTSPQPHQWVPRPPAIEVPAKSERIIRQPQLIVIHDRNRRPAVSHVMDSSIIKIIVFKVSERKNWRTIGAESAEP